MQTLLKPGSTSLKDRRKRGLGDLSQSIKKIGETSRALTNKCFSEKSQTEISASVDSISELN